LAASHLWSAARADLHRRAGDLETARRHRADALARAPTRAIRALLERRLRID
jgi:predicted RNA polymerase sigma factor